MDKVYNDRNPEEGFQATTKLEELEPLNQPKDNNNTSNSSKSAPGLGSKLCEDFEQILDLVGGDGKFQKIFLYIILSPIGTVCPFLFLNTIFIWDTPNHWCHVPGRDPQGMTLEEWKNATLPWEKGPDGQMRHSQCKMYDEFSQNETACQYGWEYDTTDYASTIPSEYDWVCDKDYYATDCFTWVNIGSAIGTVIFGIMADKYGRKPVFFLACATNLISKTVSLFLAEHYLVYKSLQLFGGFAYPSIFNLPALISVEISGTNYRSWIYAVTWMVWVIGNSLIPFIAMLARGWFLFGWIAAAPCLFLFLYQFIMDESPRWLISVGKGKEATKVVLKMAKANGRQVDPEQIKMMVDQLVRKQMKETETQSVGVWTLFSKFGIAKNTIMLTVSWSMNILIYYGITLNTTSMAGHKFFNYFILALIELPGGWVAGKLAETTGRRWTHAGFLFLCTISFLICAVAVAFPNTGVLVIIVALGIKFGLAITTMIVYLQGAEIFPTQLRSTGSGLASTVSSVVGVFGPYIVYSGTVHISFPYALFGICSLIGFLAAVYMPETLKQNLPETIEEANNFGAEHKFWSYLPKAQTHHGKVAEEVEISGLQKRSSR